MVVLLKSLSLLVTCPYYYGSDNQKNQSSHKNNQCVLIEKLGRCTRSDNNSACSVKMAEVVPVPPPPPKCVPFLMTMMKVVVLSVVCFVGLLSLSSFGGGGSWSVEAMERGVVGHQQQQYQRQWYNLNGNGNRNSGGARERHAVSRRQQSSGSDGRGESRTLDQLLKRLDGGDKISASSGRRERREDNDNNRKQEGKSNPERKDDDDDHQSGMIMKLPGTATAEQPHRHFQPRGPDNHQVKTSEDDEISDEEDDDDYYEYEDDENGSNLSAGSKNDRMSQWAENYKSSYLARKGKTPSEQSTTTTTTTTTTTPPPITTTEETYSQYKWKHLGTRQSLEEFRRRHVLQQNANRRDGPVQSTSTSRTYHIQTNPHIQDHLYNHRNHLSNSRTSTSPPSTTEKSETAYREDITEALQHAMKVNQEAKCQVPRPRVVHIQDLYPNPSKSYVPHCTILHHCSEETGCCSRDAATCAPKTTQRVELAFYSYALDKPREAIVERLVFYNHTECECRDKHEEMMPRDQSNFEDSRGSITRRSSALSSPINLVKVDDRDKKKSSLCKCPSVFSRRPLPDNICVCDCFDKQMDCIHLKHGMEHFNVFDKRCIQTGRCELPECSFGPYIHLLGRCPRRNELSQGTNSWTKYLSS